MNKQGIHPFVSFPPVGQNFPYYSWTFIPNTHLVDLIQKCHNRNDDVRVFAVTEPADHFESLYPMTDSEIDEWKNLNVDVIYGSSNKYDYEKEYYRNRDGFRNLSPNRHFFPVYFLYHTFTEYSKRFNTPPQIEYKPEKYFTCYNRNTRPHRVILLHYLKEKGLLDSNYYSFFDSKYDRRSYNQMYPFNFYNVTVKENLLEDPDLVNENYYSYDHAFTSTAFQLVTETTDSHIFLTEKTFFPILAKKPFITFGAQYTNTILKDFGFKLYDKVFDYSFDEIEDTVERAKKITEEINRITSVYTPSQIYEELKSTVEYNYAVAIDILKNEKFIPEIVSKWDSLYSYSHIWRDHVASMLYRFKDHLDSY